MRRAEARKNNFFDDYRPKSANDQLNELEEVANAAGEEDYGYEYGGEDYGQYGDE